MPPTDRLANASGGGGVPFTFFKKERFTESAQLWAAAVADNDIKYAIKRGPTITATTTTALEIRLFAEMGLLKLL